MEARPETAEQRPGEEVHSAGESFTTGSSRKCVPRSEGTWALCRRVRTLVEYFGYRAPRERSGRGTTGVALVQRNVGTARKTRGGVAPVQRYMGMYCTAAPRARET